MQEWKANFNIFCARLTDKFFFLSVSIDKHMFYCEIVQKMLKAWLPIESSVVATCLATRLMIKSIENIMIFDIDTQHKTVYI